MYLNYIKHIKECIIHKIMSVSLMYVLSFAINLYFLIIYLLLACVYLCHNLTHFIPYSNYVAHQGCCCNNMICTIVCGLIIDHFTTECFIFVLDDLWCECAHQNATKMAACRMLRRLSSNFSTALPLLTRPAPFSPFRLAPKPHFQRTLTTTSRLLSGISSLSPQMC